MLKKLAEIATKLDELGHSDLADQVDELMTVVAAKEKKKESKIGPVFPADHAKVKDKKDHFPLSSMIQARTALSQVNKLDKVPEWFKGTLSELVSAVTKAVKKNYPSIDVSKKTTKPGKG